MNPLHRKLNVGQISVKPISRSRILIHFTFFSLGQSVEKVDPATGVVFLVLYGFLENLFLLLELNFSCDSCRTRKRTRERRGRQGFERQSPSYESEPSSCHRSQIGPNLSSTTGWLYCTLRPEIELIREEICRRTNNSVFYQRLTLGGRELHTGDNIPPNSIIILLFRSRGGTRAHGQFALMCWPACSKHPH